MTMLLSDLPIGQEPKPGTNYMVPCVNLSNAYTPEEYMRAFNAPHIKPHLVALPVIGNVHSDPEFTMAGGEAPHIHMDVRFMTDWEFEKVWKSSASRSNDPNHISFPIIPCSAKGFKLPEIFLHEKMCFRKIADFRKMTIGWGDSYEKFEDEMEKHSIKLDHPICAHNGTPLCGQPVRDGIITCPTHGATYCAITGKYVRKTTRYGYLHLTTITTPNCT